MHSCDVRRKEKKKFDLQKQITTYTALIAFASVFMAILFKLMSLGRILYFQFDSNYYEFELDSMTIIVVVMLMLSCWIGTMVSYAVLHLVKKNIFQIDKEKKKRFGLMYYIISPLVIIGFVTWGAYALIPMGELWTYLGIMELMGYYIGILTMHLPEPRVYWENREKVIVVSLLAVCIFFSITGMSTKYNEAEAQRVFPIITEENQEGEKEYYVVISQGKERYSAYKCLLLCNENEDVLDIITDVHKYFDINSTETIPVEFKKINFKERIAMSVQTFLEYSNEENRTDN